MTAISRPTRRGIARACVLLLGIIAATHLLRTALDAPETPAIIIAGLLYVGALLAGFTQSSGARRRSYIPWLAVPVVALSLWAASARLFGKFDVRASIYHLQHGIEYDGVGDDIAEFAVFLAVGVILIACVAFLARRNRRMRVAERVAAVLLVLINPIALYAADGVRGLMERTDLSEHYADPSLIAPTAGVDPHNVVFIYLESLEATFEAPEFGGVMDPLTALSARGTRYHGVGEATDTGWTIAGIVASQCGVPMLSYGMIMRNRMKNIDTFLPGAHCLADHLGAQGYATEFVGAGELAFAGKDSFFASHGYAVALGDADMRRLRPGAPRGRWGVYDDTLLDVALERWERLDAADRPYLLSVLTLGAHAPEGYAAPGCERIVPDPAPVDPTLLSVACTAQLVAQMLDTARQRGWLDDTLVVVMSDHLAHGNTQTARLKNRQRENFVLFLDPDGRTGDVAVEATPLDIFPTVLERLGHADAQAAGLGRSLDTTESLRSTLQRPTLDAAIRRDNALRSRLWGVGEADGG